MKLKEGLDSMFVKNHMSWWRKPDHLQAVNENEVYFFFSIKRGKLNDFRIPSELSKIWLHLAYDIETISPHLLPFSSLYTVNNFMFGGKGRMLFSNQICLFIYLFVLCR